VSNRIHQVAERIRNDLLDLGRLIERTGEGWRRALRSSDDYYLDSVALNLHGFYAGLERIFELIATAVDGVLPKGENWHQVLLQQMAKDIPKVRPAVISKTTCKCLDEYRGFRHIVRNVYTFKLDPAKMEKLVDEAPKALSQVRAELLAFADFLEQRA
jgi:hypothetical protein